MRLQNYRMHNWFVLASVAMLWGCGPTLASVRERASLDWNCSEDDIVVADLAGRGISATGCNHDAIFTCDDSPSCGEERGLPAHHVPSLEAEDREEGVDHTDSAVEPDVDVVAPEASAAE